LLRFIFFGVKKVKEKLSQLLKCYIRIEKIMTEEDYDRMGNREEILTQLYKILEKNSNDARIYYRLADNCKRSFLKNFFKKLSHQKRIFCRRIKYEIQELEKELELLEENPQIQLNIPSRAIPGLPSFRSDIIGLITYCYKRERQYLELYKNLLTKIHMGNIREMLLYQKHSVQLALNEMKNFEIKIRNGKNEGEVKYN